MSENSGGATITRNQNEIYASSKHARQDASTDRVLNPFTPSFGRVPPIMAGREFLIDELSLAFEGFPNDPNLTSIFVGARGTGKTAMLATLAERAEQLGWIAVSVTSIEGMLQEIYEQTLRKAAHLLRHESETRLSGITVAALGGIEFQTNSPKAEASWRSRMTDVLEELNEQDVGLLITVDEINPRLAEITQMATTYQHFVMENRKVALFMAGLPHKVSALLRGESVSFLRRASQHRLGLIADYEVERALGETAELAGKRFEDEALGCAVGAIAGFPYMLQLVGYRSWMAAGASNVIDAQAVSRGLQLANNDIKERVLRATLDEASKGDLAFLEAMLEDSGPSATKDIGARLGKGASYVSTYRRRLLEQGLISDAGRGRLRYALPMLREYLPEYIEAEL